MIVIHNITSMTPVDSNTSFDKQPIKFIILVFTLSIPFWILGFVGPDTTKIFPIKLPISALMIFCPLLAAVILVYRERKSEGIKQLLKMIFDFKKIRNKKWYTPTDQAQKYLNNNILTNV